MRAETKKRAVVYVAGTPTVATTPMQTVLSRGAPSTAVQITSCGSRRSTTCIKSEPKLSTGKDLRVPTLSTLGGTKTVI